jgi:hypothetical protein
MKLAERLRENANEYDYSLITYKFIVNNLIEKSKQGMYNYCFCLPDIGFYDPKSEDLKKTMQLLYDDGFECNIFEPGQGSCYHLVIKW